MIEIHTNIKDKLNYFYEIHKIPNIIFHGPSGCGKRSILNDFIKKIYNNDKERIKTFCMYINCAFGKGIKFIREEIKFFAKTHIPSNGDIFKSIILLNADKLTMDAQSALRRCIELFSHNTRFFIVVEDKYKLLKPILSRFCEIYVPEPIYGGKNINLYTYNLKKTFLFQEENDKRIDFLKNFLYKIKPQNNIKQLVIKLYEKGYNCLDIIYLIENTNIFSIDIKKKYDILITFYKIKKEFRNEKLLMYFLFQFIYSEDTNFDLF